jgi:hypothetical protein
MKAGRSGLIGLLAGIALGTLGTAEAQMPPPAQEAVAVDRGISFPPAVGPLTRGKRTDLEPRFPGFGVTWSYFGGGTNAAVYVYDRQRYDIPADPRSDMIQGEFRTALAEVEQMTRSGAYQGPGIKQKFEIGPAGSPVMIGAEIGIERNGEGQDSFLFLSSYRGNFLKVRYTAPAHQGSREEAEKFALSFLPKGRG